MGIRNIVSRQRATAEAPAVGANRQVRRGIPWRVVVLVVGDALSFLAFATQGRQSHGETLDPAYVVKTAFPFALAWFLVAPWLGVYRQAQTTGPRRMLARTELGWLATYPLALVLRWIFSADHQVPLSFAAVILAANAVFLGAWRSAFALVERWANGRARER